MKWHEASLGTAHAVVIDDNEDTRASAELLTREGGAYKHDEIHPKTQQTEIPTVTKGKSQVDNVISSCTEIKLMVAKEVSCTMEQLVFREIPTLGANSLDNILQCTCENARTKVCFVVYKVVEQIIFELFRGEVFDEILEKNISKYFDTSYTADKVGKQILSLNDFMVPITAFTLYRTSKSISAERVATKVEKKLKSQAVDTEVKRVQKSVSPPSRTNSAPSHSSSDINDDAKTDDLVWGTAHTLAAVRYA